jgi:hypothetical protein
MITGLLGTAIAAAICLQLFGTEIFRNIFGGDRVYSLARMLIKSAPVLAAFAPAIIVSVRLLPMRRSDRRLDLFLLAAAFGLVLGFIQRSGQGVDRNAHFEALIALSITGALALAKGGYAADRFFLRRPLALLILPLLVLLPQAIRADVNEYKDRTRNEQVWKSLVDRIAATPGRVACELPAACFRAGKAYEVDFFLYGQRVLVRHDASALRQAIKERRFAAIQLDPPDGSSKPGKVRDPLHVMFEQHYRTNFTDDAGRRLLMPIDR